MGGAIAQEQYKSTIDRNACPKHRYVGVLNGEIRYAGSTLRDTTIAPYGLGLKFLRTECSQRLERRRQFQLSRGHHCVLSVSSGRVHTGPTFTLIARRPTINAQKAE